MTYEARGAWRLAVFQARSGLWHGYARSGDLRLSSRAPTEALARQRLRAIVADFDATMTVTQADFTP